MESCRRCRLGGSGVVGTSSNLPVDYGLTLFMTNDLEKITGIDRQHSLCEKSFHSFHFISFRFCASKCSVSR